MLRKLLPIVGVAVLLTPLASAQIVEIPAMTVLNSWIDMDNVAGGAGPTTLADVNAAGTAPGGNILGFDMLPGTAAQGTYNFQPDRGNALGYLGGQLSIIAPPAGSFDAIQFLGIDLGMASTQFGFSTGDWSGPINADLFSGGGLVGTIAMDFAGSPEPHFLEMQGGGTFDRVEITCWPQYTGANWVTPDLYVQIPEPMTLSLLALGGLALLRRR